MATTAQQEAVSQLHSMFPQLARHTIHDVYLDQGSVLERAVEALLALTGQDPGPAPPASAVFDAPLGLSAGYERHDTQLALALQQEEEFGEPQWAGSSSRSASASCWPRLRPAAAPGAPSASSSWLPDVAGQVQGLTAAVSSLGTSVAAFADSFSHWVSSSGAEDEPPVAARQEADEGVLAGGTERPAVRRAARAGASPLAGATSSGPGAAGQALASPRQHTMTPGRAVPSDDKKDL